MTHIQKNCAACGDIFSVRLADHKRGWGKCCDKACAAAYKCGQRPRDVNEGNAKHKKGIGWAADKLNDFSARYPDGNIPQAPSVKSQAGKVKVKPIYHSPSKCRECGVAINGPGLCYKCADHDYAMGAMEYGWDGHKGVGP